MKPLFLLAVATVPMLLSACVGERETYYRRPHPYHRYAREEVVVAPGTVGVVYYNDARGRYYWRHHRRVYVRY
ncbi:MAG: hypothetical protein ABJF10_15375 [Chthoniobacter sp.]|uniref:hypothetical protein n=1 Tax=Chthoniobacter sp. TaxID=2510640 RepID=UPI0032A7E8E7